MKLQYLGDAKDSFKWDYHDFLVSELGYPKFAIALMLTPDDGSSHGKSCPTSFPAREEIIDFCGSLRRSRSIDYIYSLPEHTGGKYKIEIHKGDAVFDGKNRFEYFSGFGGDQNQVVFLDPDIGLEPEKSISEKHVRYDDIRHILDQINDDSIITVFQNFRRRSFIEDFAGIKERLPFAHTTAIYWNGYLMFVAITKSEALIHRVSSINQEYAKSRRITVIG